MSLQETKLHNKQPLTDFNKHHYVCDTDLVMLGVGYHHAGVSLSDRKVIEEAFTRGELPVLCESFNVNCCKTAPSHHTVLCFI